MLFFPTRKAARSFSSGKLVDNGPGAGPGRRWGRQII